MPGRPRPNPFGRYAMILAGIKRGSYGNETQETPAGDSGL